MWLRDGLYLQRNFEILECSVLCSLCSWLLTGKKEPIHAFAYRSVRRGYQLSRWRRRRVSFFSRLQASRNCVLPLQHLEAETACSSIQHQYRCRKSPGSRIKDWLPNGVDPLLNHNIRWYDKKFPTRPVKGLDFPPLINTMVHQNQWVHTNKEYKKK